MLLLRWRADEKEMFDGVKKTLKQGVSAHELSLCVAIGVVGGLWPVPLTSWIGCVLLQSVAGVRPVLATVIQAVNFAMTPVELATFAYFISAGEEVRDMVSGGGGTAGGAAARFDASTLVSDLQSDLLGGLQSASGALLIGLGAWVAFVPVGMCVHRFVRVSEGLL